MRNGTLSYHGRLVCGFWYTENHYQSRIRQARSNGWNSYFYVAMHGCKFAIQGFTLMAVTFVTLLVISSVINFLVIFGLSYMWTFIHGSQT